MVRDSQGLFLHAASQVVNDLFQVRELKTLGLVGSIVLDQAAGF